ncbi:MAG: hypothetical protein GWM98_03690, partial [Nitrospinaceae bacterium]|nr:hypothetical protein [Nitrospinaceae bacterium]NIR53771.1 hypothetical protein [Nitrospinaceae bacterium]NIS84181.1 hypothetical protein [Nitrospinaceae bacterium]NIT80987.1 hypothetical protein [Nitrospinaceae bacterium]NIU43277.1 hypothetical protein [Nitrospinaceae bacterium]
MKFQRSMYWAFLFLIAGGVGAFLNQAFGWARAGAEPQRSGPVEDLRVRTLVVEDSEGRPRIRLGVDRDGSPYFMMRNQEGVDVFSIHSKGKLGSMITLSHPDWVNGLQMMVHPERGPLLALSDREGK